jgi:hypothetical protein
MYVCTEPPIKKSPSSLADWLEINSLADPDGSVSRQDLISLLGLESEDDQVGQVESEDVISQIFSEIERRVEAVDGNYPFSFSGDRLIRKRGSGRYLPYIFCLLISYFGVDKRDFLKEWKKDQVTKKFEDLSAKATKALLGDGRLKTKVRIFGFPRRWRGDVTNPRFTEALRKICLDCGELTPKNRLAAATANDGGLDIIAWKRLPDKLPGNLFFLGQCAAGANWSDKLYDIESFLWFVEDAEGFIKGTFIPHVPDTDTDRSREDWSRYRKDAGILFNRCRIAFLVEEWEDNSAKLFCQRALAKLRQESRIQ